MKRREQDMAVGQDSFLDTTANLVGVLIILVVVIGAKTRTDAVEFSKRKAAEAIAETEPSEELIQQSRALQVSLLRQKEQLIEYEVEKAYRERERNALLEQVALAREGLEQKVESLDAAQKELLEQKQDLSRLEGELAEVQKQLGAAEEAERPKVILEHLPTPMAKTVFTRELHLQLKDRRVTVVPWDRLVETLKVQVPLAVRRKGASRNLDDSLGPIGGFLMHYSMRAVPAGLELEKFELEATAGIVAETVDEAFQPSGRVRLELASRNPGETVVTVWVYPDSFAEFRQLKKRMFDEGFLTAARPLPHDVAIGASPQGTRSSAQ